MQKIIYVKIILLVMTMSSCRTTYFTGRDKAIVNEVARWQMDHFSDSIAPATGWVHAALYRGMVEWAGETNSRSIYDFLFRIGEQNGWDLLPRVYDADDLCIGQTYFKLYDKYADPKMIQHVSERVNYIMAHPDTGALITERGKYYRNRWGWCDALFMAPPVYVRMYHETGNEKYLDFCFAEYKVTADSLYDRNVHLFYRDLTLKDSTNAGGEKIFWGRGNGWVYAGLALLLNTVPKSHPSYNYYLKLFREMSEAIVSCQDQGTWHTSLLEKDTYPQPENSASGFFVFGLAWGINNGIFQGASYKDAAVSGWKSLKKYVDGNGKLGYIQPVGHAPVIVKPESTAPYGVGAFLLAATEMRRMKK